MSMSTIDKKIKKAKETRVKLGDVVTFTAIAPFVKSISPWGTIVEIVERGITDRYVLCGIKWFNEAPDIKGNLSYHYESELVRLDEKLAYDALGAAMVKSP